MMAHAMQRKVALHMRFIASSLLPCAVYARWHAAIGHVLSARPRRRFLHVTAMHRSLSISKFYGMTGTELALTYCKAVPIISMDVICHTLP
ncbi:hypothetical protein [Herbaspirillum sp. NPDC087042]|uniref:hypothetical protein n=1 Tax=Herbaspirillum sp. NPDC087042 TaxID=3364004 RepID=UPI003807DDD0